MPIPVVRPLRFDLDHVPRYWHGGRKSVSAFFDNLSVFFPEGEKFFVQSVKRFRDAVTDPQLAREVEAFCAQECHHTREHVRYNAMLARMGYPIAQMERRVRDSLKRGERILTPRQQLAMTAALEHFTSLLGTLVLKDPRVLDGADPQLAALWRWHAAEENEHKSVAFDVYLAVGGTWRERSSIMVTITLSFWARVVEQQVRMMHADETLFSPREWAQLLDFLFVKPNGLLTLLPAYFAYFRPGFHPSQIDSRELLERWKAAQQVPAEARA